MDLELLLTLSGKTHASGIRGLLLDVEYAQMPDSHPDAEHLPALRRLQAGLQTLLQSSPGPA